MNWVTLILVIAAIFQIILGISDVAERVQKRLRPGMLYTFLAKVKKPLRIFFIVSGVLIILVLLAIMIARRTGGVLVWLIMLVTTLTQPAPTPTLAPLLPATPVPTVTQVLPTPTSTVTQVLPTPTSTATPTAPTVPPTGTICVLAFNDLNGNSLRDSGEPLIAGATITITGPSGDVVSIYTTDSLHEPRCFPSLVPGNYRVEEKNAAEYPISTIPDLWAVAVSSGTTFTVTFGDQVLPITPALEPPKSGRIAYTEYVAGRSYGVCDIYIANVDGSGRYKLVEYASEPVFSPDGQRLAFHSWPQGGTWVINLDGTGLKRVSPDRLDAWPTWSLDQSRIAYAAWSLGRYEIYSITVPIGSIIIPSGDVTKIIDGEQPSWGPDGRIVYKGCFGAGGSTCGLMIVNPANKGTKVRITTHANDSSPIWSHVTNKIVFASDKVGNWDIYVVNPDGSEEKRLTTSPKNVNPPWSNVTPTWSADGQWIFFRSDRDGGWAIWAMKPDGSNQVRLFPSSVSERRSEYEKLEWERLSAGP
jgi:TolB protein